MKIELQEKYKVFKHGDKFAVHKLNPDGSQGEMKGQPYDNEAEADKYAAALYANMKDSVQMGAIPPEELGYMADSPIPDAVCAKCCYLIAGTTSYCQKVRGAIDPKGWCRSFEPEHEDDESSQTMPEPTASTEPAAIQGVDIVQSEPPATPPKAVLMTEAIDRSSATLDADNRVLKNVVLIKAGMSANRKLYKPEALKNSAKVFEGTKAFVNHPSRTEMKERPERSVEHVSGWYKNVRFENNMLVADRYFSSNAAGQNAFALAQDVLNGAPATLAGLSINAAGVGFAAKDDAGDYIEVENISHAYSVDDVTEPAAGGAYKLTASGNDPMVEALMQAMSFDEWFQSRPDYIRRVQNEMKTVRQETAIKEVTEAKELALTEAGRLQGELEQMKTSLREAETAREAAEALAFRKAQELAIVEALGKVSLKQSWKQDLKQKLIQTPEQDWPGLIEAEVRKAKDADALPQVEVPITAQPIVTNSSYRASASLAPRPGENEADWRERVRESISNASD